MIASALHHAKLEPPVFTGDTKVNPEEWLQAVKTYSTSLNLTDAQILNTYFLGKEIVQSSQFTLRHLVTVQLAL